jgi:hypothetical protein
MFKWSGSHILDIIFTTENEFFSVGVNHFNYWTIDTLTPTPIKQTSLMISSCAKFNETLFIGLDNGTVESYLDNTRKLAVKIHSDVIDCMTIGQRYLFSGGKDGLLVVSDISTLKAIVSFDIRQ